MQDLLKKDLEKQSLNESLAEEELENVTPVQHCRSTSKIPFLSSKVR